MANDILVKIGADISDFSAKMKESQKALSNFNDANKATFDSFKKVGGAVTAAGATVAAGLGVAAKHAIDFESSFAGVRKTVDATEAEFAELEKGIRDMSKELPASVHEINGVAEAAGQLGIKKENILEFTRTMIDLGEATNLTSEEAATSFARFANIVGMSQEDFDRLGSSVVELGNNMATTEAEIVAMGMRLAGQGAQIGMTESQIMALAASMSSVGIEAEAGGTAMSMVMKKINTAVGNGGKALGEFAKAAGVSSKEFSETWKNDPVAALDLFIKGLGKSGEAGGNLAEILADLGIKGIREQDTLLRLAGASDILSEAVDMSTKAWDKNTALSDEAEQRYATMASKLGMLKNTLIDIGISIGQALTPAIGVVVDFLQKLAEKFSSMSESTQSFIAISAAVVAALGLIIGPILMLIGFIPSIVMGFGALSTVISGLGAAFTFLTGPVGLIIAAIVGIIAAVVLAYQKVEWFRDLIDEAWLWIKEATMIAFEYIKGVIQTVMSEVADIIKTITSHIKDIWDKHGDAIMSSIKTVFGVLQDIVKLGMNVISNVFKIAWPVITGLTKIAWETIKTVVDVGINLIFGIIKTVMSLMRGDWKGAWESIRDTAKDIWNRIEEYFASIDLVQIGKDIIQGLIDGIGSMGSAAWQAAKSIASRVKEGFTNFFKIKSPSRVMRDQVGVHIGTGLAAGIKKSTGAVTKAAQAQAQAALKAQQSTVQKINNTVMSASNTYASKIMSLNKKLTNDIKKANADYDKALADRTKSIANQIGLFDKFEAKAVSKKDLIGNLRGQVQAMRDFSGNLAKIGKNAPKAFVDELREMGLDSASEISAIAGMTKKELAEYVKLWKQKQKAAGTEAAKQLEGLKTQTTKKINELRAAASNELNLLRGQYIQKLRTLAADVKKLGSFRNSGKVLGKNAVAGIINGLGSMNGALASAAKRIAQTITKTVKSTLKIKSPSRVMIALAKFVPIGVARGMDAMIGDVRQASARLTGAMTPEAPTVSMAYATPRGTYDSLATAVNGSVDIDSRDSMLAGAIDDLRRDLTNLRVEMDKREVGRIVAPTVGQELNDQATQTTRGRGRRRI